MIELEYCPYCGGEPQLTQVGDQKELFVYICSQCHKTPVRSCEGRLTPLGAKRIWNQRATTLRGEKLIEEIRSCTNKLEQDLKNIERMFDEYGE